MILLCQQNAQHNKDTCNLAYIKTKKKLFLALWGGGKYSLAYNTFWETLTDQTLTDQTLPFSSSVWKLVSSKAGGDTFPLLGVFHLS